MVAALGWWWLIVALAVAYVVLSVIAVTMGFPDRFTNEKSLTVATWGLVLATLILFSDSFYKSKERRERWEREDRLREEDAKPNVAVELA